MYASSQPYSWRYAVQQKAAQTYVTSTGEEALLENHGW